jgi:precorrin-6x reductase
VDATHPFAAQMSLHAARAAELTGLPIPRHWHHAESLPKNAMARS